MQNNTKICRIKKNNNTNIFHIENNNNNTYIYHINIIIPNILYKKIISIFLSYKNNNYTNMSYKK